MEPTNYYKWTWLFAHSITAEYLRYFYIQQLSEVEHLGGKIIYVPH